MLLYGACASAQIDTVSNLSDAEKIVGLSKFWSEASNNFVFFDKTHINWDSTYQAFIPKVWTSGLTAAITAKSEQKF